MIKSQVSSQNFPTQLKYKFYVLSQYFPEEFKLPSKNSKYQPYDISNSQSISDSFLNPSFSEDSGEIKKVCGSEFSSVKGKSQLSSHKSTEHFLQFLKEKESIKNQGIDINNDRSNQQLKMKALQNQISSKAMMQKKTSSQFHQSSQQIPEKVSKSDFQKQHMPKNIGSLEQKIVQVLSQKQESSQEKSSSHKIESQPKSVIFSDEDDEMFSRRNETEFQLFSLTGKGQAQRELTEIIQSKPNRRKIEEKNIPQKLGKYASEFLIEFQKKFGHFQRELNEKERIRKKSKKYKEEEIYQKSRLLAGLNEDSQSDGLSEFEQEEINNRDLSGEQSEEDGSEILEKSTFFDKYQKNFGDVKKVVRQDEIISKKKEIFEDKQIQVEQKLLSNNKQCKVAQQKNQFKFQKKESSNNEADDEEVSEKVNEEADKLIATMIQQKSSLIIPQMTQIVHNAKQQVEENNQKQEAQELQNQENTQNQEIQFEQYDDTFNKTDSQDLMMCEGSSIRVQEQFPLEEEKVVGLFEEENKNKVEQREEEKEQKQDNLEENMLMQPEMQQIEQPNGLLQNIQNSGQIIEQQEKNKGLENSEIQKNEKKLSRKCSFQQENSLNESCPIQEQEQAKSTQSPIFVTKEQLQKTNQEVNKLVTILNQALSKLSALQQQNTTLRAYFDKSLKQHSQQIQQLQDINQRKVQNTFMIQNNQLEQLKQEHEKIQVEWKEVKEENQMLKKKVQECEAMVHGLNHQIFQIGRHKYEEEEQKIKRRYSEGPDLV